MHAPQCPWGMEKESLIKWIYVKQIHLAVHLKLTQHHKSTIRQSKKILKRSQQKPTVNK